MSSILKALKKLETETADKEPEQFVWPQPVDTKAALNSRIQDKFSRRVFSYKAALIFFCSTTLILLMFIAYSIYIPKNTDSVSPAAVNGKPEKPVKLTDGMLETATEASHDSALTSSEAPDIQTAFEEPEEDQAEKLSLKALSEKDSLTEHLAKEEGGEPAKKTEAGWLTLQGISWSGQPSKRMAVINSTIVREGKAIDGGRVARIDKKYVVIEKNGEELMLTFD